MELHSPRAMSSFCRRKKKKKKKKETRQIGHSSGKKHDCLYYTSARL
jgi:hypothetical protein